MRSLKNAFEFEKVLISKAYTTEKVTLRGLHYWYRIFDDNQFENVKSLIARGNYEINKR
jgi:hypothetical protein